MAFKQHHPREGKAKQGLCVYASVCTRGTHKTFYFSRRNLQQGVTGCFGLAV